MCSVYILYTEKGIAPFKMPLLILIGTFLILYMGVYGAILSRLHQARGEMDSLNASAQYASVFNKHHSWLTSHQKELPPTKDKDNWLFNIVARTSQQEAIENPSISQQTEREMDDFIVVTRKIGAVAAFKQAAKWIERIENSPLLIRISQLTIEKNAGTIGFVKLRFQVETVFMKTRTVEEANE